MRPTLTLSPWSAAAVALVLTQSPVHAGDPPRSPQLAPAGFVANDGQWDTATRFATRRGVLSARLEDGGVTLESAEGAELALRFGGGATWPRGEGEQRARYHFFVGNDRQRWRTGVRSYDAVRYPDIAPGVDVVVRQGSTGLQYDFELVPGARAEDVAVRCSGARSLAVAGDGTLRIGLEGEVMQHTPPVAWQTRGDGSRVPVQCGFRVLAGGAFGLWTEPLDPGLPTVIDPQVQYGTYLGGSSYDTLEAVAIDAQGFVYAVGDTFSSNFVPTVPLHGTKGSGDNTVWVAKLDPQATQPGGSLVYIAMIGGTSSDYAMGLALGAGDSALYLTGWTQSADFPAVTPTAGLDVFKGEYDGFVACLDAATGSVLAYSVLLGGSGLDIATGVAADGAGRAYVTGGKTADGTASVGGGAASVVHGPLGGADAFAVVLDVSGALLGSALLGGAGDDVGNDVVVDAQGHVYLVGASVNDATQPAGWFPRVLAGPKVPVATVQGKGRNRTTEPDDRDGFVARLDPTLGLEFATLVGGSAADHLDTAALAGNRLHAAGGTASADVPTVAPLVDPSLGLDGSARNGAEDALVVTYDFGAFAAGTTGPAMPFATYFGGSGDESVSYAGLAVDGNENLYLAGRVDSGKGKQTFPSTGTPQLMVGSGNTSPDAFLAILTPASGSRTLAYSTLAGGSLGDLRAAVAVGSGNVVLGIQTNSEGLFTTANRVSDFVQYSAYVCVLPSPVGP